ncbi:MAG TPA: heme-binding domain-containing protein [Cyclobacteriaceae bacterium]|nr:heme-binding domain-containing protein [Cyclobacteriaceae bacterium]
MVRKILIGLLLLAVIAQLLQPTRNISEGPFENDISKVYAIPADVQNVFTQKCYDCHSNNTRYPWYIHIQPIGWWMASHIKEAKDHLNFSEFKTYDQKRATHKLEELVEVLEDGSMPIKSYVWLHSEAKVTTEETQAIKNWIQSLGIVPEKQ